MALFEYPGILTCALLLLGSCLYLVRTPGRSRRAQYLAIASAFGLAGPILCALTLKFLAHLRPMKLDYYVFRLDGLTGFEPSFWIGSMLLHARWLEWASSFAYAMMPAAMVLPFAVHLAKRPLRESGELAAAFICNLLCAVPFYLLIPVCGPRYAFPGFPFSLPSHLVPHAIQLIGPPPNGVPSVHTSTALLACWFLRRWLPGRIAGVLFVALTVVATLGSGEHYLFDLLAAVPYAIGVVCFAQFACRRLTRKRWTLNERAWLRKPAPGLARRTVSGRA